MKYGFIVMTDDIYVIQEDFSVLKDFIKTMNFMTNVMKRIIFASKITRNLWTRRSVRASQP